MKISIKINLFEFYLSLVVLFLGAVYLWYVLPEMDTFLHLIIILIAIILILILGRYLKYNNQVEKACTSEKHNENTANIVSTLLASMFLLAFQEISFLFSLFCL